MPATDTWTTRKLLAWIASALEARGIDSPKRCADDLVCHVLGCKRLALYTDADRPASPGELAELRGLVKRALNHEPIQYLVGEWSFFALPIKCDKRALIPRPSTETIVEHALQHARREDARPPRLIADVCTGTGCVALALAKNLPEARVVATDISTDALDLARENAEALDLANRVELIEGDLLDPLQGWLDANASGQQFDLIVSNPPYIPDDEWADVEPNVKDHEPTLALRGGPDGLDLVRPLLAGAPKLLAPNGWVLIETAASNARTARDIAATTPGLADAFILQDHEGLDRVVAARKS